MKASYNNQVRLLVNILPIIERQKCFALKGGTAINLFYRDMPRLSVDIDLAYLPVENRDVSLNKIDKALKNISKDIEERIPRTCVTASLPKTTATRYKLMVQQDGVLVKIEVTPVLRGSVFPAEHRRISKKAEKTYGFAAMTLLSFEDLYAGKICAALDRQHPRDLYDIHWLLKEKGITEHLKNVFLVYLMSHNRPMAELLEPHPQDISTLYRSEFEGMTFEPIHIEELEAVLANLTERIHEALTDDDRHFLMAFKKRVQEWNSFSIPEAESLPAIQWKLKNFERMNPNKRRRAIEKLENALFK